MSAHANCATSGCQLPLLLGLSVTHQPSTPPTSNVMTATLRQKCLTNTSVIAAAIANSPATTLFALPNGASYQTAPNAQTAAMMSIRRTSDSATHRTTRTTS